MMELLENFDCETVTTGENIEVYAEPEILIKIKESLQPEQIKYDFGDCIVLKKTA